MAAIIIENLNKNAPGKMLLTHLLGLKGEAANLFFQFGIPLLMEGYFPALNLLEIPIAVYQLGAALVTPNPEDISSFKLFDTL